MTSERTISRDAETRAPAHGAPEWLTERLPVPYTRAVAVMEARVAAIAAGRAREQVWLLEHEAVLTAGTSARDGDLLDAGTLPTHRTGRGGQWTWHGPGQRVAYVMLDLARDHGRVPARDLRAYVQGLEAWLIAALASYGVDAGMREGRVGLWVADPARPGFDNKIAAIGVRVTRWVCWHGVALNVAPDLSAFDRIIPCGITGHGVTSLAGLGIRTTMQEVDRRLAAAWGGIFGP